MGNPKIVELTGENFAEVTGSDQLTLVDFWAEWCGPCRMVAPTLDQLADEMDGKVNIAKVNIDQQQQLAIQHQVQSIPTFLLFKDGQVVDRMMGAMPKAAFESFIERNV